MNPKGRYAILSDGSVAEVVGRVASEFEVQPIRGGRRQLVDRQSVRWEGDV